MSARAEIVEVLIEKSRFEPRVALGVSEAIDMAIADAQPVTVPILDARFVEFKAGMDARFAAQDARIEVQFAQWGQKLTETKAELVRWVFLVMLGNVALTAGITAILNALQRSIG